MLITLALRHTWQKAQAYEADTPQLGEITQLFGTDVHYLDLEPDSGNGNGPALFFIHGAGGNLRDPLAAFKDTALSKYRMIYADRPGQGYSEAIPRNHDPARQAAQLVGLLDELGLDDVVLVGHSYGAAVALAAALDIPDRFKGLVLISPASHPWPGGVAWYYHAATWPFIGPLLCWLMIVPAGEAQMPVSLKRAFWPEDPPNMYAHIIGAHLALRPRAFRANAFDISRLIGHVRRMARRYGEIKIPTTIITGDADRTVLWTLHSKGLERDIDGAQLHVLEDAGHMPHHTRTAEVAAIIEQMTGSL